MSLRSINEKRYHAWGPVYEKEQHDRAFCAEVSFLPWRVLLRYCEQELRPRCDDATS